MNQIYNSNQINSASITAELSIPQTVIKEVEVPGPEIIVNNIYTTKPTPIGTWIDGKTIYRQVVPDVGHGLDVTFGVVGPSNVETYINIKMVIHSGVKSYSDSYGVFMLSVNENNQIVFSSGSMASAIKDFIKDLIIEYTTTDDNNSDNI